jgi:aspartate aminotransferase
VKLSSLVSKINPSYTLEMTAKAAQLRNQGVDVIDFGVGEPDFNTPSHIIEAAYNAMKNGYTKYTAGSGSIDLKQSIQSFLLRSRNVESIELDNIIVSSGAKQSLSVACQALFDKEDEVIIFSPYWVSFPEFVKIAGAKPVIVTTALENNFEPLLKDVEKAISRKTKGIIINSPGNPTGAVWSSVAFRGLLEIAKKNNITVISDETYDQLVFDGDFVPAEVINKNIGANILTVKSLSKTYAMTGWRVGFAFGEKTTIKAMAKIQAQTTSCPNSISQRAAMAALDSDQGFVNEMKKEFLKRRNTMNKALSTIDHIKICIPGGAFYYFVDLSYYYNKIDKNGKIIEDSFDLSNYILDEARVVTVAGDAFGAKNYIRLSFATNEDIINEGISRIKKSLSELKQ